MVGMLTVLDETSCWQFFHYQGRRKQYPINILNLFLDNLLCVNDNHIDQILVVDLLAIMDASENNSLCVIGVIKRTLVNYNNT